MPAVVTAAEVRADLTGDPDPRELRRNVPGALIYSLRSRRYGGNGPGAVPARRRRLLAAARDYDLVDLEADHDLVPAVLDRIPPRRRRICWCGPEAGAAQLRATVRAANFLVREAKPGQPGQQWRAVLANGSTVLAALVCTDGVMGHLYTPGGAGHLPVLERMRSWLAPRNGVLVNSSGRPPGAAEVQPAPGVPGFYWLSGDFLRKEAEAAGFQDLSATTFVYQRPLSGARERAVLTGRA